MVFNNSPTAVLKVMMENPLLKKFSIVFLDPPFGKAMLADTLAALKPHLAENALVYIEQEKSANEFIPENNWQELKYKKTSSFSYALYCLAGE